MNASIFEDFFVLTYIPTQANRMSLNPVPSKYAATLMFSVHILDNDPLVTTSVD